jgi:hypothetical protein
VIWAIKRAHPNRNRLSATEGGAPTQYDVREFDEITNQIVGMKSQVQRRRTGRPCLLHFVVRFRFPTSLSERSSRRVFE